MFHPLTIMKTPMHVLLKKISKSNPRAQSGLIKAFATNNPSYGLLNAWAELEFQVKKTETISFKKSANKQIIVLVSEALSLSKSDQKRLKLLCQTILQVQQLITLIFQAMVLMMTFMLQQNIELI